MAVVDPRRNGGVEPCSRDRCSSKRMPKSRGTPRLHRGTVAVCLAEARGTPAVSAREKTLAPTRAPYRCDQGDSRSPWTRLFLANVDDTLLNRR